MAEKRKAGEWGDHPELQALSELYGRPIELWVFNQDSGAAPLLVNRPSEADGIPPIRWVLLVWVSPDY